MKPAQLAQVMTPYVPLLQCPLCREALALTPEHSLKCPAHHTFDLSAKGYANLAPGHNQQADRYSKALFQSRHAILADGFYQPVAEALTALLAAYAPIHPPAAILDAGCGEGYYLRQVAAAFPGRFLIGLDLSRDAITAATREGQAACWLIANLARLPLRDGCCAAILNILTPADYGEFERVLAPDGIVLKVIPGGDYLRELRQAAAPHLRQPHYSNQQVLAHLHRQGEVLAQRTIHQTHPLTPQQAEHFARMTPLTFGLQPEALQWPLSSITLHLEVLCCRLKRR